MIQTIVQVQGMACDMCQAHVNDAIRKAFRIRKVQSDHKKGQTVILSEEPLDEKALKTVIDATGYRSGEIHWAPYEKKGLFSRIRK